MGKTIEGRKALSDEYQSRAQGFLFMVIPTLEKIKRNLSKSSLMLADEKKENKSDVIMADKTSLERIYNKDGSYKYILNVGGWFVLLKNPEHIAMADKIFKRRNTRVMEIISLERELFNPPEVLLKNPLGLLYYPFAIKQEQFRVLFGRNR